jgi:hypothetical protein
MHLTEKRWTLFMLFAICRLCVVRPGVNLLLVIQFVTQVLSFGSGESSELSNNYQLLIWLYGESGLLLYQPTISAQKRKRGYTVEYDYW